MPGTFHCSCTPSLPMLKFFRDSYQQCSDDSNELNHGNHTCNHDRCISASYECGLDNDCGDNSIENSNQCLPYNDKKRFRW
ncbi:unnamed protein product [Rotaria sp. Silwood1]|nr:unnamed protein product [Rotaria sp. Silwood1]